MGQDRCRPVVSDGMNPRVAVAGLIVALALLLVFYVYWISRIGA